MKTRTLLLTLIFSIFTFFGFSQNCVDFESLTVGDEYGDGINTIGEVIFTENDIPVSVEYFEWNPGGTFGTATVQNASGSFGTGKVMWTNNINLMFDFTSVGYTVTKVNFEYADYGGFENFSVNGHPIYVGELSSIPSFPDVSISHTTTSTGGIITIYGEIQTLIVGGQEFQIDNVCAYEAVNECVDFESLTLGDEYGDGYNFIGEVIFTEADIPVAVEYFYWNSGGTFGNCTVQNAASDFGDGYIMGTNNINLKFDFTHLGLQVEEVTFEYADAGGFENLEVNGGGVYVGELESAPNPPGVSLNVTTSTCSLGEKGFVTLTGAMDTLMVGGQEFWLDNICVYYYVDVEETVSEQNSAILGQNYPNPVITETTIPYKIENSANVTIEIFNNLGKKVIVLRDEYQKAGSYEVIWDGTDGNGNKAPNGVYLYELKTDNTSQINKMILIR